MPQFLMLSFGLLSSAWAKCGNGSIIHLFSNSTANQIGASQMQQTYERIYEHFDRRHASRELVDSDDYVMLFVQF